MAKKPAPQPRAVNRLRDRLFQMNVRNSAIAEATNHGFTRAEAREAVSELDDGDIEDVCKSAGLDEQGRVVHAPTEGVAEEPEHGAQGPIIDFIKSLDPAVKKAIIDLILRLIGIAI